MKGNKARKTIQHNETLTFNVTQFKIFSHLMYNFIILFNFPTSVLAKPHQKKF
jgi:hypothetical protein